MPPELTKATTTARAIEKLMSNEQAESIISTFHMCSEKDSRQHLRKAMWSKNGIAPLACTTLVSATTKNYLLTQLLKLLQGTSSYLNTEAAISIIADTGCSWASTFEICNFRGPNLPMPNPTCMHVIGNTIEVQGHGTIQWTVIVLVTPLRSKGTAQSSGPLLMMMANLTKFKL
jgi:hypothetical protein